ncbi:WecB/TagA/CpsF family glycosyltransferase [Symbiobacterium thermophilum]|nr:WecB/TagA/CpsF family glycosyltransferase [Symbiobacterium thermophilum]
MKRAQILSIGVDKVTMAEAVDRCLGFIDAGGPHLVVTPNAEIADRAGRDPELAAIINGADLVVPDGAGIVLASRLLGDPVPEKVGGADLASNLLKALNDRGGGRVFLLGTRPEVVAEAARRVQEAYPRIQVVGWRDGFFRPEEEGEVVAQIRAARPDVLFVALGSPKQERWLHRHLPELGVPVGMGVGGTIDVWAGAVPRAPQWMIRANLEWLYRIVRLRRVRRSLPPLVRFGLNVLRARAQRPNP